MKNPPHTYLQKLRSYLDPALPRKVNTRLTSCLSWFSILSGTSLQLRKDYMQGFGGQLPSNLGVKQSDSVQKCGSCCRNLVVEVFLPKRPLKQKSKLFIWRFKECHIGGLHELTKKQKSVLEVYFLCIEVILLSYQQTVLVVSFDRSKGSRDSGRRVFMKTSLGVRSSFAKMKNFFFQPLYPSCRGKLRNWPQ